MAFEFCPGEYRAEYYDDRDGSTHLEGTPRVRCEARPIDYNWRVTNPPGVGEDGLGFSARWVFVTYLAAGEYTFTARSDDGIRVWVGDDRIINDWTNHSARPYSYTTPRPLPEGIYTIKVEYYSGPPNDAVLEFDWA